MRKAIIFILVIVGYLFSCQLVDGGIVLNEQDTSNTDTADVNPNGSSELSLLMREMYDHALNARILALKNQKNGDYPKVFNKIHTATPTDSATKNSYFDTFADVYLNSVKAYASAGNTDLKINYNNLVNTCLACHSTHCPGPIPKIKKLLLP